MNTIKIGSKGEDVKTLQKLLGLTVDGDFGVNTDKKVKEWQTANNLVADGIVGAKTWEKLLSQTNTSSDCGISMGMIEFICFQETGKHFGYKMTSKDLNGYDLKDAKGHKTYGYGLLFHPISQKYMDTVKKTWTQKELESLFLEHAHITSQNIDKWVNTKKIKLNQNQKDAIASACYNFGMGFLDKQICKMISSNPNNPAIRNTWSHLSDTQGKKYPGLIKRRQAEAKWYFEGK